MAHIIRDSIEQLDFENLHDAQLFNIELLTDIFCCTFSIESDSFEDMEMSINGVDVKNKEAEFNNFMSLMVKALRGGKREFVSVFIDKLHYYERYEILNHLKDLK